MNGQPVYPIASLLSADVWLTDGVALAYTITEPPSWIVLSVFSLIGLFFVFYRFWSLRNLDILLILAFIPGFMLVYEGQQESDALAASTPLVDSTKDTTDLDPTYESPSTDRARIDSSLPKENLSWVANSKMYWGFLILLICCGLLAVRMLWDTGIVRRPLLEPNLNSGGMLFIGISLLIFLMVNIAL
ncbi:MAG: hypothetical protein RLZZ396_466, partial [Planctomycetota bacterium]